MNTPVDPPTTEQLFGRAKARQKTIFSRFGIVLGISIFILVLELFHFFDGADRKGLDFMFQLPIQNQKEAMAPALILISEKSLQKMGPWPWPNRYLARLTEMLHRLGARGVYFDFPLTIGEGDETDDKLLVESFKRLEGPIYLAVEAKNKEMFVGQGLSLLEVEKKGQMSWQLPPNELSAVAVLGHRQLGPDLDGVFRHWSSQKILDEKVFDAVSLQVAQVADKASLRSETKPVFIPWNRKDSQLISKVEASDLFDSFLAEQNGMSATVDSEKLRGRIFFVGLAKAELTVMGRTPWGDAVSPVEVAAAIAFGLERSSKFLREAPKLMVLAYWTLIFSLMMLAAAFLKGKKFWLIGGGLFLLTLFVPLVCFAVLRVWMPWLLGVSFSAMALIAMLILDHWAGVGERSSLFHLATRDGLTGLYVIRHFRIIMNQMTREACARKEPLVVILMDIDHFKKINDTYGHPAGDMVLKKVAAIIQSAVRQKRMFKDVDFVARYGGEEFIVLVRRNSLENVATHIAERIRKMLERTSFEWEEKSIQVTVSLGVAELAASENVPDAMVHRADKALYLAKQTGRNRVCTEKQI